MSKTSHVTAAARDGDVDTLAKLLQQPTNVNHTLDEKGYLPLHFAAMNGHLECLKLLITKGADPQLVSHHGSWTPCHLAAMRGHAHCVRFLASHGANIFDPDDKGNTAGHMTATHGHLRALKSLLDLGDTMEDVNDLGWSPFMCAAFHGHLACLQTLAKRKVALNLVDTDGNSALHLASGEGHLSCVKYIISVLPNEAIYQKNKRGETPVTLARRLAAASCTEFLDFVQKEREAPDVVDETAFPVHQAAAVGDVYLLRELFQEGAKMDSQDPSGSTPLHKAAGNGHVDAVRFLLQKNVRVRARNYGGETARDVAMRYAHEACIVLLGGDILEGDSDQDELPENGEEEEGPPPTVEEKRDQLLIKIGTQTQSLADLKTEFRKLGGQLEEDIEAARLEQKRASHIQYLNDTIARERLRREKAEVLLEEVRRVLLKRKFCESFDLDTLSLHLSHHARPVANVSTQTHEESFARRRRSRSSSLSRSRSSSSSRSQSRSQSRSRSQSSSSNDSRTYSNDSYSSPPTEAEQEDGQGTTARTDNDEETTQEQVTAPDLVLFRKGPGVELAYKLTT
eukprot:m.22042 g.22042  ORF g.22042 m.22042 type:complete len:568 (+) comp12841_c0_seq2:86-1789(+)